MGGLLKDNAGLGLPVLLIGVGLAKRSYLSLCRSEADIAAMRAVKQVLDPDGILAPGRVLDAY